MFGKAFTQIPSPHALQLVRLCALKNNKTSNMKKIAIIFTLMAISSTFVLGQTAVDSISMEKGFGGYVFYQGDQKLKNVTQLANVMKSNPEAHSQILSAKSSYNTALVLGGVGGAFIGWPLGTALGGGEPNWALAGIGAGLVVVSIPLTQSFNKKAIQAVQTFNSGARTSSFWDEKELNLTNTNNGIGLTLTF